MENKPSRYEIEETKISEVIARRFPELAGQKIYRVYEKSTGKTVPFGRYSDRNGAVSRIKRLEDRDAR